MSRPTFSDIVASVEAWDAEINSFLGIFRTLPWPVTQLDNSGSGYATIAAFAIAYPPGSYDRCVVFAKINDQNPVWGLYWSDGAAWSKINGEDHGASVSLSADQSIPDATLTRIDLDSADEDPDTLYDGTNKAIKAKLAGKYLVEALVSCAPDAGGTYREFHLCLNGTAFRKGILAPNGTSYQSFTLGKRIALAVNDLVQLKFKHDKGSALNVIGAGTDAALKCSVSVTKVDHAG